MLIVIIVFLLFMAALGGLLHFASAQSSTDEYDVEKQTKGIISSLNICQHVFYYIEMIIEKIIYSFYFTKAGKENQAYVTETSSTPAPPSTRPTSSAGGKWANNYVPYGDFPQGSKEV